MAINALGESVASAPSNRVTPTAIPAAPTAVTAVAGNAKATVSWTAPANGGSAITRYTVTASPGGKTAITTGATTADVTGLTNGTAYTFTVTATNTWGTSSPSAPSSPVTPWAKVVERWAGADRFASSAAFSAKSYPVGVSVAYVADGMNFPDALSGAPIAGKTGGPVLLTKTGSLPSAIAQELTRLKPQKIVVLGGTGAVSGAVAAAGRLHHGCGGAVGRCGPVRVLGGVLGEVVPGGRVRGVRGRRDELPRCPLGAPIAGKTGGPVF